MQVRRVVSKSFNEGDIHPCQSVITREASFKSKVTALDVGWVQGGENSINGFVVLITTPRSRGRLIYFVFVDNQFLDSNVGQGFGQFVISDVLIGIHHDNDLFSFINP